jgi:hypothetical protein
MNGAEKILIKCAPIMGIINLLKGKKLEFLAHFPFLKRKKAGIIRLLCCLV